MTEHAEPVQRKVGRPTTNATSRIIQEAKAGRLHRAPVGGFRDILTVEGKDPDFVYRWVADESEEGNRIFRYLKGGYEFSPSEDISTGEAHVYKSKNNEVGNVVRVPNGARGHLYLMRIRRDWYEEDQRKKSERVIKTENELHRTRNAEVDDGMYGGDEVHVTRGRGRTI